MGYLCNTMDPGKVHRQEMPHPYGDCVKVNNQHRNRLKINTFGKFWHWKRIFYWSSTLDYSNLGPQIKMNEKSNESDLLNDLLNKTDESTLDHDPYSAKSCMYECRMDAVVAMCSCIMPHYMIKWVGQFAYTSIRMRSWSPDTLDYWFTASTFQQCKNHIWEL